MAKFRVRYVTNTDYDTTTTVSASSVLEAKNKVKMRPEVKKVIAAVKVPGS